VLLEVIVEGVVIHKVVSLLGVLKGQNGFGVLGDLGVEVDIISVRLDDALGISGLVELELITEVYDNIRHCNMCLWSW
jgi:hypothetical protein